MEDLNAIPAPLTPRDAVANLRTKINALCYLVPRQIHPFLPAKERYKIFMTVFVKQSQSGSIRRRPGRSASAVVV
jgi:hypothetical protein